MLEVSQLVKSFNNVRAVDGLTMKINGGEIVGLLGPNGAGKTTTLRCLCGILKPDYGSISVGGYNLVGTEAEAKRLMAFIPEVPMPYELLTVREHVKFVAMCFNTMDVFHSLGDSLLQRFDLLDKADSLVVTLSKGMRQKLAVVCAFVHEAKLYLFDEPMVGIDPQGQHTLKMELQRLKSEGCAILVSTHQLDTAERLCDRVIIMQKGKMRAAGTLRELQAQAHLAEQTLEEVFLKLTEDLLPAP